MKKKDIEELIQGEINNMAIPTCDECGCLGNETCGHKPLDQKNGCTLDALLVCPCCNIDLDHMKPEPDPNQLELL